MPSLSVVMITKNEEQNLARSLSSVVSFTSEIVVVDTGSTDKTKEIAASFGAKIFDFEWIHDFSAARNFALKQSTSDWNFILDADEYVSEPDIKEIHRFLSQKEQKIGRVKRIDSFRQNGEIKKSIVRLSRFLPKGAYYEGRVHEQVIANNSRIDIDLTIFHEGYLENNKTDRNLDLLLLELKNTPNDDYVLYQLGKQYKLMEDFKKAEDYFEKSYFLCPQNIWHRSSLVVDYLYVLLGNKSFDRALTVIEKEEKIYWDLPDLFFLKGLFYMEYIFSNAASHIALFSEIEKAYLYCLQLGETEKYDTVQGTGSFLAAYNLGVFYELTGNKQGALKYYDRAVREGYGVAEKRLVALKD